MNANGQNPFACSSFPRRALFRWFTAPVTQATHTSTMGFIGILTGAVDEGAPAEP